jgi:hypothetical protein
MKKKKKEQSCQCRGTLLGPSINEIIRNIQQKAIKCLIMLTLTQGFYNKAI